MSDDYIHGVKGDIVREQRRLDAERELLELRRGDPDRASYGGSREEMATTPLVTIEPAERLALHGDDALQLVSMTFRSRSGNTQPHIVTLRPDGTVQCICDAHMPCWAQKAFRMVKGMQ